MTQTAFEHPIHIISSAIDGPAALPMTLAGSLRSRLTAAGRTSHLHDRASSDLATNLVMDPDTQIVFFMPTPDTAKDAEMIAGLQASIRQQRKDLYLVLASRTVGSSSEDQYFKALELMKKCHANLVLAYDDQTRQSMVVVPEESYYAQTTHPEESLDWLVKIALARAGERFTRSQVVDAPAVPWDSPHLGQDFRAVVDHLVSRGAYKPFRGKTAGHFAVRGPAEGEFLTSRRGHDFNQLPDVGLVRVVAKGRDEVIAYGSKPSVGGQSQRIVFEQHPDLSNIVHFHSPLRAGASKIVPVRAQWPFECGSHQCGQNTADGLKEVVPGIFAVMLENHGPNIVFGNDVPAGRVIDFIENSFDLTAKTGYRPDAKYAATDSAFALA